MIPVIAYTVWQAYQAATHYAAAKCNAEPQAMIDVVSVLWLVGFGVAIILLG